ncbi:LOW QUALITY PROTEIN: ribonuclease H2 subunit A [Poecile atricapillus]|uniref:LOW QUALITY PROTEIN: ribonuclease H2 subunit A n=1 Tax=Poecile atricapillus TaxID=48891 RepID=UPI00273A354C|nr:LOW QUALITY PROTEIN: ribonuclease H2 subunit A [Poecile atricapillus]
MALSALERDPAGGGRFASAVPPPCRRRPCALGVDEAGRGAGARPDGLRHLLLPEEQQEELQALGRQGLGVSRGVPHPFEPPDSKTLSEAERERRFGLLEAAESVGWALQVLPPTTFPACMQQRAKYNLNELSHDAATELIQFALDSGVQVTQVFVDTVGPADKYEAKLRGRFPGLGVTVRPKADALFPVVSAASICAKVARDRAVLHWNFLEDLGDPDRDFGSGYPNDPKTKEWLRRNLEPVFGFPQIVRFSWGTAQALLQQRGVPVEWADEDPPGDPQGPPSVLPFLSLSPPRRLPHRFFRERSLRPLSQL